MIARKMRKVMLILCALCVSVLLLSPASEAGATDFCGCDVVIGSFQLDIATLAAISKDYFKKEGLNKVCFDKVVSSIAGFNNLLNGTYLAVQSSSDNTIARVSRDPPLPVSILAGTDMGAGYTLTANVGIPDIPALTGAVYAADAPTTGLILFAYEIARLGGVDISTLTNISGFDNEERLSRGNGTGPGGLTADFAVQGLQWGLESFFKADWPAVKVLARISDYLWPIQGGVFTVRADSQGDPEDFEKLRRFLRAVLRGYLFISKPRNERAVKKIIREAMDLDDTLAQAIYDIYIPGMKTQTGFSPLLVPYKRGLFNIATIRHNTGFGPAPILYDLDAGAGKTVDLRALDAAMADLDLGSAFDCYETNLLECWPSWV